MHPLKSFGKNGMHLYILQNGILQLRNGTLHKLVLISREGGSFNYSMEAKDGSFGFDFNGTFDEIVENQFIAYTLADGREVKITFSSLGPNTHIEQEFEAEGENPVEMQKAGWQAILDNFKSYIEGSDEEE